MNPIETHTTPPKDSENTSISFDTFLSRTYPKTTPLLRPLVSKLISSLRPLSFKNENGQFALVRGGAMRSLILSSVEKEAEFSKVFRTLQDYSLIGITHPLTEQVANEAFNPIRDLDIRLFPGQPVELTNQLREIVTKLDNPNYLVIINEHNQTTNQCHINIYSANDRELVFRIDLAELPKDHQQIKKNSRYSQYASDFDQLLIGYISSNNEDLYLTYNASDSDNIEAILGNLLDSNQLNVFSPDLSVHLSAAARAVGFRGESLLTPNRLNLSFIKLWQRVRKDFGIVFPLKNIANQIISWEEDRLSEKRLTILSDLISAIAVNPFFSLPHLYLGMDLNWMPLGQLISNDLTLFHVFTYMANELEALHQIGSISKMSNTYYEKAVLQRNPNLLGPFMIIRALKNLGKLKESTALTVSNFLALIDPLLLANNQWRQYLEHNVELLAADSFEDLPRSSSTTPTASRTPTGKP